VRHGLFTFQGRELRLPLGMPPHAILGVAYDRPWRIVDARTIAIDLDQRWPFGGRVTQRFELGEHGLLVTLTLEASRPMPAMLGWHPWFRRVLVPGDPPARLELAADAMLVRDAEGVPTGERVPPTPGPWDDAFTGVREDPVLEWPGRLRLAISSSCTWWVVFSTPEHAICVEPQSGPPDAFNGSPQVVEPGAPLSHWMRWRWTRR
jgi:aldose 1-epimerase